VLFRSIDGQFLVVSTDPCIGVPEEWFGYLLIHYAASDVALFGAKPEFCTINILGPPSTTPRKLRKIMAEACKAADQLDMAIVTGHTGTYRGISTLIGVTTAYGTARSEKLKTPANIRSGDIILCVKPVGLEIVVNFALKHKKQAEKLFGTSRTGELEELVPLQSCVNEAIHLNDISGVHAMHDATEGGLTAALSEMADTSKLGFTVDFDKIRFAKEAYTLQKKFHLSDRQLLSLSSTGTFIAAIDLEAVSKAEKTLETLGVEASRLGTFTKDSAQTLLKKGRKLQFPTEPDDPYDIIV
jgi:hydrogenase expression/formation protein HypE